MSVRHVTVQEAHQRQGEGSTYVDVRSIPEFQLAHPAGAVNVPLLHHDPRTGQMLPNPDFLGVMSAHFPRDARLLIGCQVGGRSAQAAQILAASGYTDVSNVLGGFGGGRSPAEPGWAQAGLPIESGDAPGQSYEELHRSAAGRAGGAR